MTYIPTMRQRITRMVTNGCWRELDGHLERHCPSCERWLPYTLDFFSRRRKDPMGLLNVCKPCNNHRVKAYQADKRGGVE